MRRALQMAAIVLLLLLAAAFNGRLLEMVTKEEEVRRVRAEATAVMQTQQALQTLQVYAASDQAPQDWARDEGRYIQEGDHPVIPVAPTDAPGLVLPPLPSPTPTPPNWQLWLWVFFGK